MTTRSAHYAQPLLRVPRDAAAIARAYHAARRATEALCEPLEVEDYCIQSMPDASPTKWHLAHTSWFFETFVLQRVLADYEPPHPDYAVLFNSYYNTVGEQHDRAQRGVLSRPTVAQVLRYREHVDRGIGDLLEKGIAAENPDLLAVIETGIHHEQQHQELLLMDIKHAFSCNPLRPPYRELPATPSGEVPPLRWIPVEEGMHWIGHDGPEFAFDNESPRHRNYVDAFHIADRLITCGEYLEFIDDGGYQRPQLWLSDGWHAVEQYGWRAPLYWEQESGAWRVMTLRGMQPLNPSQPVGHVSYYEADAFARWKGCWLPRESAWEAVAAAQPRRAEENFLERGRFEPAAPPSQLAPHQPAQIFGDLWEWTCSPYGPYPGYRADSGALGEYNGKFMCNQMVLRGGSYGTPRRHIRPTYRNFFPPDARWPFTGIRLSKEHS